MATVLGIDPGFSALGLAAVDLLPDGEALLAAWVVTTEKSSQKREVRASDDNLVRAQQLGVALEGAIRKYRPVALACEAMSYTRMASVAHKVGMAWGTIAALASMHGLPVVQASPQEVKKALCDAKTASKEEVILAIETRFPSIEWPSQKGLREHAADAVAAVVACLESAVLQMARQMERAG